MIFLIRKQSQKSRIGDSRLVLPIYSLLSVGFSCPGVKRGAIQPIVFLLSGMCPDYPVLVIHTRDLLNNCFEEQWSHHSSVRTWVEVAT